MQDLKGRKFGPYELMERLGRGGMAEVYRAYQPSMDRFVAIKVMFGHLAEESDDFIERFRREAQEVGKLRHPHIVNVFDFGDQDDLYYMVMEYIKGGTLKAHIKRKNGLPPREALSITAQIADALDYAHKAGMVHRDLKPANIMFIDDSNNHSVLTDFGIARIMGKTGLTASGAMVGTPAYMSPEVGRGKSLDHRADLYGLGVILYEMLAGRVPYDADTPIAVIMQHANAPLPSRQDFGWDIPDDIERLILRAMAKEPDDRFQSADEMRTSIEDSLIGLPGDFVAQPRFADPTEVPTNRYEPPTAAGAVPGMDESPTTVPPARTPELKARHPHEGRSLLRPGTIIPGALVAIFAAVVVIGAILLSGGSDGGDTPTSAPTELGLAPTEQGLAPSDVPPTPGVDDAVDESSGSEPEAPAAEVAEVAPPASENILSGLNLTQDEVERLILAENQTDAFSFVDNLLADDPENVEALAARSALLTSVGNYDEARADAQAAIDLAPDNPLGYYMLIDALRFADFAEDTQAAFATASQAMTVSDEHPQAVWRLAATARDVGEEALYQEMLARSLEENPRGIKFLAFAGSTLFFDDDYERALPYLRAWQTSGFDNDIATELLGSALVLTDQANAALEMVRGMDLSHEYEFSQAAYFAYRAGDYEQARDWAQNALALAPDYDPAEYTLGLIRWYANEDLDAARARLEPFVGENYDGHPYHTPQFGHIPALDMARILSQANQPAEAVEYYQITVENYPNDYQIWVEYGEAKLALEQPDEALEVFRSAFEVMHYFEAVNPDDRNSIRQRIVNLAWGDEAVDVSNPPVDERLSPELIGVQLHTGLHPLLDEIDELIQMGENGVALDRITAEIEANPDNADLHAVRAWVWLSLDEGDNALDDAETAINLNPDSIMGYLAKTDIMMHWVRNDYEAARISIEEAALRQPDHPEVVWRTAWINWWTTGPESAPDGFIHAEDVGAVGTRYANIAGSFWYDVGDYERALPLLKTDLYARNDLTVAAKVIGALIQLEREDEALELAYQLTPLTDRDPPRYDILAYAAYRAGDFAQARAWVQVALAFWPEHSAAAYIRGLLAWDADQNLDEAIAIFDSLRETDYRTDLIAPAFGHEVNWERARILREAGDFEAALGAYEDAMFTMGDVDFLRAERAEVHVLMGNLDAARDDFRSAYENTGDPVLRDAYLQRLNELNQ